MRGFQRLLAVCLALLLLSGCSGLSYEDLYSLPRASEDYYDLQEALSGVLESGYGYLAPASGARREPVQLVDLDGDGTDEAVAFFRSADRGEVKLYIFSQAEGVYTPAAVIDGTGSAVAAVEYADLDGSGSLSLLVTYQVSESVPQALQVYRYSGGAAETLLTTGCSRYELGDLSGDEIPELLCLLDNGADAAATASCYRGEDGALLPAGEETFLMSYDQLRQVLWGKLSDGTRTAALSGAVSGDRLGTVLLTMEKGTLQVVLLPDGPGSTEPIHGTYVYPADLDGDGVLEFPATRQLPAFDEGSAAQWVVDWYRASAGGSCRKAMTAYHNFSEGWYLELLDSWDEALTIKASDESTTVSTVTLFRGQGTEAQEILTVYTLRGASRSDYAAEHSLTILNSDSETIYAVTLAAAEPWEGTVTLAQVSELFHAPGTETERP